MSLFSKLTKNNDRTPYPWSQRKLSGSNSVLPRFGHATAALSSDNLVVYGGIHRGSTKKDLFYIDANNLSASHISATGDVPSPRCFPTIVPMGTFILLYGGEPILSDDKWDPNLYFLNLNTRQWTRVQMDSQKPVERAGHSAVVSNGVMYIWGGKRAGRYLNDLVAFNTSSYPANPHWEYLSTNEGPSGRSGHVSVIYDNKLYIFGGTDGTHFYNDILSFDLQTRTWAAVPAAGFIPAPRQGCSAALVDDVMYINGGIGAEGQELGDLCAFKFRSQRWYMFQNMGPSPSARHGLTMTTVKEKMYVIGGEANGKMEDASMVYVLDSSKIKYPPETVVQAPSQPSASPSLSSYSVDSDISQPPRRTASSPQNIQNSQSTPIRSPQLQSVPHYQRQQSPAMNGNSTEISGYPDPQPSLSTPLPSGSPHHKPLHPDQHQQQQPVRPPRHVSMVPEAALRRPRATSPLSLSDMDNGMESRRQPSASPTSPTASMESDSYPSNRMQRNLPPTLTADDYGHLNQQLPPPLAGHPSQTTPPQRPSSTRNTLGPLSPPPRPSRDGVNLANSYRHTMAASNESLTDHYDDRPKPRQEQPEIQPMDEQKRPVAARPKPSPIEPSQQEDRALLLREIKARDGIISEMKKKEQWWRTEVSIARKQRALKGEAPDDPDADAAMLMDLGELDQHKMVLFEQLVSVKSELRRVRASIGQQAQPMADKILQADRMRTAALQEAAYFKSKYQALKSQQGHQLATTESQRVEELELRLTATLKENEANGRLLQQLQKRAQHDHNARLSAEERAKEAQERAEEAQDAHQRALEDLAHLHTRATKAESQMRDNATKVAELTHQLTQALSEDSSYELSEAQIKVSQLEAANMKARNETASLKQRLAESVDDIARLRTLLNEREEALNEATRHLEDSEIQLGMMKEAMSQKGFTTRAY
ncbi:Negative regulator of mitotic exit [Apophysomyces sp. BC1034]|nr:Negative regulator of mitotic exit [Apophysomyces sp. BC1015]KAG0176449.1 Negative regulator of mitotic exit [Apophysomyces sp. BC1021]KAG0187425.1 Negative regulator of mitotic exit [Apophysomyces sp. BC1034]